MLTEETKHNAQGGEARGAVANIIVLAAETQRFACYDTFGKPFSSPKLFSVKF